MILAGHHFALFPGGDDLLNSVYKDFNLQLLFLHILNIIFCTDIQYLKHIVMKIITYFFLYIFAGE